MLACARWAELPWTGRPSELSPDHVHWSAIDAAREASAKEWGAEIPRESGPAPAAPISGAIAKGLRDILRQRRSALGYAEYYVQFLRQNGGKSADCLAR